MSGSNSSDPAAVPSEAPLRDVMQLTVYDLDDAAAAASASGAPAVDAQVAAERMRRGRRVMLLILLACSAPVVAAYLAFFVVRWEGKPQHGTLIQPTRALPTRTLTTLDGQPVPALSLKGQWLLVVAAPSTCDETCERLLYTQRQLRQMVGRERDRIDKVWFVTDDGQPRPALLAAVRAEPEVTVLRFPQSDIAAWLAPEAGQPLQAHLYLVDPMGELMLRFPVALNPQKAKGELDRLLRASSSWDRAGR